MLFIKLYYYFFLSFIYLLVGVGEGLNWLRNPHINWTALRKAAGRAHLPFLHGIRPKTEQY